MASKKKSTSRDAKSATRKGGRNAEPREAAAEPKAETLSLATYTERRDERIAYYYFVRRVTKPPAIYDYLVRECRECLAPDTGTAHADTTIRHKFSPLVSENRDSGLRTVQAVVMRLRQEAAPEEVLRLRRPVETAKVRKSWEYLLQKQIEVIEDNSFVQVQKVSPSGMIVTVEEPRCSKQDKGKAVKAAMVLVEKLGKLEGAQLVAPEEEAGADPEKAGAAADPYVFSFPHVKGNATDLNDMIAMNLDSRKVN